MTELDRATVEGLSVALLLPIRAHLGAGSPGRYKVHEVLNALAAATALVVSGTGASDQAEQFFQTALRNHLES